MKRKDESTTNASPAARGQNEATSNFACRRLLSQHLCEPQFTKAAEIVTWLGEVQAQDFASYGSGLCAPPIQTGSKQPAHVYCS